MAMTVDELTPYMRRSYEQIASGQVITFECLPEVPCRLWSVLFHLSAAPSSGNILTLRVDSSIGAAWDTVLDTQDMNGLTDFLYIPPGPLFLGADDAIDLVMASTVTATASLQVTWSPAKGIGA